MLISLIKKILVFLIVPFICLAISLFIYSSFYYLYIPKDSQRFKFHLDYKDRHAESLIYFGDSLSNNQKYNVRLHFQIPDNNLNNEISTFMLHASLMKGEMPMDNMDEYIKETNIKNSTIYKTRVPVNIPYENLIIRLFRKIIFWWTPLFPILGINVDMKILEIDLFNGVYKKDSNTAHLIVFPCDLNINNNIYRILQVYSACIVFDSKYTGLQYPMYHLFYPFSILSILGMTSFFFVLLALIYFKYFYSSSDDGNNPRLIDISFHEDNGGRDGGFLADDSSEKIRLVVEESEEDDRTTGIISNTSSDENESITNSSVDNNNRYATPEIEENIIGERRSSEAEE